MVVSSMFSKTKSFKLVVQAIPFPKAVYALFQTYYCCAFSLALPEAAYIIIS